MKILKNWNSSGPIYKGLISGIIIPIILFFILWILLIINLDYCQKIICPAELFNMGGANCRSILECDFSEWVFLIIAIFLAMLFTVPVCLLIGYVIQKIKNT